MSVQDPPYIKDFKQKISKIRASKISLEEQHKAEKQLFDRAAYHYSDELGVPKATALKALEDIIAPSKEPKSVQDLESEINRAMAAVRLMSPKVNGLELREQDNLETIKYALGEIRAFRTQLNAIDQRVELLNTTTLVLTKAVASERDNYHRIPKISYLFKKVVGWISAKFKN
jgi:hypothetical protein